MFDTRKTLHDRGILDVIKILAANGESGRLEMKAGTVQGAFFFKNGRLVDARVGHLTGFQALNAVAAMRDARFHFDPTVAPPEVSSITANERVVLHQFFGVDAIEPHDLEEYSDDNEVTLEATRIPLSALRDQRLPDEEVPVAPLPVEEFRDEQFPVDALSDEPLPVEPLPVEPLPVEALRDEAFQVEPRSVETFRDEAFQVEPLPLEALRDEPHFVEGFRDEVVPDAPRPVEPLPQPVEPLPAEAVPVGVMDAPSSRSFYRGGLILALMFILIAVAAVALRNKYRERTLAAATATTEQPASKEQPAATAIEQPALAATTKPVTTEQPVGAATTEQPATTEPATAPQVALATPIAQPKSTKTSIPVDDAAEYDLSGRWTIINTVQKTSYRPFADLKVAFALSINQSGKTFTGKGQKVSENGRSLPAGNRTPIEVQGSINGDQVEGTFSEQGALRKTNGRFVWRLDKTGALTGTFVTTAAQSSGKSAARKS